LLTSTNTNINLIGKHDQTNRKNAELFIETC